MAALVIGVPRWHLPIHDGLLDHSRLIFYLGVTRHLERPDIALAMAVETFLLQDRDDLSRIRHLFTALKSDPTTMRLRPSEGHRFSRKEFLQRGFQIMLRCLWFLPTLSQLIINGSAIN